MTASGVKAAVMSSPASPVNTQAPSLSPSSSPKKPGHTNPSNPEQTINHHEHQPQEQPQQQQQQQAPRAPPKQQSHPSPSKPQHRSQTSARPTASGDGEAGDVVGEYVLGETIGKGTFGKVKVGLHLGTGEKVAVKILEKKRIVQIADVERVAREIKILKRNRHLNVIQLYEVIDSPERIYLIMEHVDGGEMFEYIVSHHRVREQDAVVFFQQIVDGLAYLHANDVTHRDLKPENLLLQSHATGVLVKIVDFGLSNTHDGGRLLRTACGSPCYAAPEMIEGKLYRGPVADIWSLGVVLFAMVCGYLPFEDSNTNMLYKKILSADYKLPPFLSHSVQDLIRKILETNPEKRFTVDMIRQHPWFTSMRAVVPRELAERDDSAIKERVLEQLATLGFDKSDVLAAVEKNAHNNVTASYYLLYAKLLRITKDRSGRGAPLSARSTAAPSPRSSVGMIAPQQQPARPSAPVPTAAAVGSPAPSQAAKKIGSVGAMAGGVDASASSASVSAATMSHNETSTRRHLIQSAYSKRSAARAATPSGTASPRHGAHQHVPSPAPGAVAAVSQSIAQPPRRPSSVRSGRTLVLLTNGSTHQPASSAHAPSAPANAHSVVPMPPRDRRPTSVVAPKPSSAVAPMNGMVALAPLVHHPVQHLHSHARRDAGSAGATSHTSPRRHTVEISHHVAASPRTIGAASLSNDSSHVAVARRRITLHPAAAASPPPTLDTTKVSTASPPTAHVQSGPPSGSSVASQKKDDDARPAQTLSTRIHAPQPPSNGVSRPLLPDAHFTNVII